MTKKDRPAFPEWLARLLNLKENTNKKLSVFGLVVTGLIVLLYLIFSFLFLGRVYPHSFIGETNLAHLNKQELRAKIEEIASQAQSRPINLKFQDQLFPIEADEITFRVNVDQTVQDIISQGRQKPWWQGFFYQVRSIFAQTNNQMDATYDDDLLDQKISLIVSDIDQPAVDASAQFVNDKLVTQKELAGNKVDLDLLKNQIVRSFRTNERDDIIITRNFDLPEIVLPDIDSLRKQVDLISERNVILSWGSNKKNLTQDEIKQLIGFVAGDESINLDENNQPQRLLKPAFTLEKNKSFLSKLAVSIDQPAVDPKLVIKDGALAVSTPSKKGRVVDIEQSAQVLYEQLQSSRDPISVELMIVEKEPLITENNLGTLGIKELIGQGTTGFSGSTSGRRSNIINGVSLLSSALVKPGEEFSTVRTLGEVSDKTGFVPELVIKENKTEPEFGGGLCQVSTTLFRAVLNAGLKVTERRNHSYRVSYYEPPVGLDATIYLPKPDLRFFNDTSAHILIQGRVSGNKVVFELWGTKDGRQPTISDPVVTNIKEPPEPIYVETDTLNKGETKQIEKAHQGATATIEYTVTRGDQVIIKQTFKSVYKAWAARFLVGTKEETPPPPTETPPPA